MKAKLLILFLVGYGMFLNITNAAAILPVGIDNVPKKILDNISNACRLPDATAPAGKIVEAQYDNKSGNYYIDTECPTQLQDKSFKLVKSRFYYKFHKNGGYVEEDGGLNNILGVLVPANRSPQIVELYKWKTRNEEFVNQPDYVTDYYKKTIADSFTLSSPARLTINSNMRTQNETFVTENHKAVYIKKVIVNNLNVTVGSITLASEFLKAVDTKLTSFTSRVENYDMDGVSYITGLERPAEISNVVYLRIDGSNLSYVFGLRISSYIENLNSILIPTAKIELICLTDTQCNISGSGDNSILTWNDGSNISFGHPGIYADADFVINFFSK